jgi:urease accessory protein
LNEVNAIANDGLTALFQLTAGGFPTGAFAHSLGLETVVQDGTVHDVITFGEWLDVHLTHSAGPTDGAAVSLMTHAVTAADWDAVIRIDRLLTALKLAPEVREASCAVGRSALRAAREVFPGPAVQSYAALLRDGEACGNMAAAFACIAVDLKLDTRVSVLAYLWSAAASLTAVATRLVPLGGIAAQRCLRELSPVIHTAAARAEAALEDEIGSSSIAQDIAALRHGRLYSRLCIS